MKRHVDGTQLESDFPRWANPDQLARRYLRARLSRRLEAVRHWAPRFNVLDMKTGRRVSNCDLSTIDSTFLIAGPLMAAEAFIHIIDSMFNQHARLKISNQIPWRRPIASLNYLLTSHVWRQDHNGFSHQDPGFIDHVANKKADVIRVYLPPDANTLLSMTDTACAAATTSTSSSPASSRRCNGWTWTRRSRTAPPALASGRGRATIRAASRMSSWRAAGTADARNPGGRSSCCGAISLT